MQPAVTLREQEEYSALRATIRERGTTRVYIFALGLAAWAALLLTAFALALPPVTALVPLLVLTASYEAVRSLHVGVERLGRYLLVFHGDQWERAAGSFARPGGAMSADALFTVPYLLAAILSILPLMTTTPIAQEWIVVVTGQAAFVARVLTTRAAAARQRDVDTARFRELQRE